MTDLISKHKNSILVAGIFLVVFAAVLFLLEAYLFRMDISEDGMFKAESISKTLQDYDSVYQNLSDWLSEKMITNIRLSAFHIRNKMTDGTYTGRMVTYEGLFVRIEDGQIVLPDNADDLFKNLQPEDIMTEYTPKTVSAPDGEEFLIVSACIEDGLYYITWMDRENIQMFYATQANMDQILTYMAEAYGGDFFVVSDDAPADGFTTVTDGFADLRNLADLGLQPKDLEKQHFSLRTETNRYMCYVLPLENRNQTVVYCDIVNDEVQTGIHRAFTKILFAGSFLTALLVLCFSTQQAVRDHTLSDSEIVKYTPKRMKQKILLFSLLTGAALMLITVFTTFVQESHHENRKGTTILDSLEMQLSESERRADDARQLDIGWYEYLGAKISAEATNNPLFIEKEKLSEVAEIVSADLIMVFDEEGRETACSSDYIGYSLDDAVKDQDRSDFHDLLRGTTAVIREREPDFVTGEDHYIIGIRYKIPDSDAYGALLLFIPPSAIIDEEKETVRNARIYSNLTTGEELIMEIDPDTFEILSSSSPQITRSTFMDLDAGNKGFEKNELDIFALNDILYYGIPRTAGDRVWYYAEKISGVIISALVYAAVTGLVYLIISRFTAGYAMRGFTPEFFEACLSADRKAKGKPSSGKNADRGKENESPYKAAIAQKWQGFSPMRKSLTVLWVLCGLIMLILLVMGFLSRHATLAFYVTGNWQRGINPFSVTAIFVLICIGRLLLFVMDLIFIVICCEMSAKEKTVTQLVYSLLRFIIIAGLIYNVLAYLGVNTRALLASVGIISLALSLGAKDLVSDVLAGLGIVIEGTFETGEIVEISGFKGVVDEIGIRSTKIRSLGTNNIRTINNSGIHDVINYSRMISIFKVHIDLPILLPIDMVKTYLKRELPGIRKEIPQIISGPTFSCIDKLDNKMMTITIRGDCQEKDVWLVTRKMNMKIKERIDQLTGWEM